MFSKIIVGVDGSEGGRDALALAARTASVFGGELERVGGELERVGVVAHAAAVPDGSPGRALHLAARRHDGDLIVVGSAHRGAIGRVLAGDVTIGTLHGAECPVLVAPRGLSGRGSPLLTIGVAFDGSPESRAATELARDLAVAAGAALKVIGVLEPTPPGGPTLAYHPDWAQRAEERREQAQARLDAELARLGDVASGELVVGDPATELAYAANELDLLVTGSRGYGPLRRLVLGSTSARLVREAPCPVLVLTRGAEVEAVHEHEVAGAAAARGG
jgi:nucleotide-binding universal stress UspA family protein